MKRYLGLALFLLALGALVYGARSLRPATCNACRRPITAGSRTVALVAGKREVLCCPACALSLHRQRGAAVRLLQLTDYESGAKLAPGSAFLVEGSDVATCTHHRPVVDETMHPAARDYDRCSPALIAFSSRAAALRFLAQHGGTLLAGPELLGRLD